VEPVLGSAEPAAQATQELLEVDGWYLPIAQDVHADAPVEEYLPAAHPVKPLKPVEAQ
jgi:hypothetical protein